MANCIKTLTQCNFGNDMPKVGKGKTVTDVDFILPVRDIFNTNYIMGKGIIKISRRPSTETCQLLFFCFLLFQFESLS